MYAPVAELAYAYALGAYPARVRGSTPLGSTKKRYFIDPKKYPMIRYIVS